MRKHLNFINIVKDKKKQDLNVKSNIYLLIYWLLMLIVLQFYHFVFLFY